MAELEQELASIMGFVLGQDERLAPYYWNVPENFMVPAVYFPSPEIATGGDTLSAYKMDYLWNLLFFHKTTEDAYGIARHVLEEMVKRRNLIPLIDTDGKRLNRGVRIDDSELKKVDEGAVQLKVSFTSRRPYVRPEVQKMQEFHLEESNKLIQAAMEEALEQYGL